MMASQKMIDLPILIPLQSQIDDWLEIISYVYEGTNTI